MHPVYVKLYDIHRAGGKAAIGYSYGDNVGGDYNMSDNDSDVESIQEEEGLLCVCPCCAYIL